MSGAASRRSVESCRGCRRIRGSVGYCWPGAEHGVLRETSIAAALLSERDPFRAAEQGRRGPRDHGTVRSRSDVVDRVPALQAFYAGEPRA